jgi:acyl-CoA synthetase (AMP-forming)/AMP-acid ligase II
LLERAAQAGIPVRYTYGLTENASQAATERKSGGGLELLPGMTVKIGGSGEILLRSPALATGWYQDGSLKRLPLEAGFFRTGDLGRLSGEKLEVYGRESELMISGGVNVFPAEIERWLSDCPLIGEAAVVSVPDEEWGETICLVTTRPVSSTDTVRSYLAERVEHRKLPKIYVHLPEIPRSSLGKVLRSRLRQIVRAKLGR